MIDQKEIRRARLALGLTQEQAGDVIGATRRAWQDWELGQRNMPPAKWELFQIKTRREKMEDWKDAPVQEKRRFLEEAAGANAFDDTELQMLENGDYDALLEKFNQDGVRLVYDAPRLKQVAE